MKWAFLLLAALAGGASAGQAQPLEIGIHGGASLLRNSNLGTLIIPIGLGASATDTLSLQDGFRLGFRITLNSQSFFGHELGYAYNRSKLHYENNPANDGGMAIHQGFYDFLGYATREGKRVRPFLAAGIHFNNYVPPGASVSSGGGQTKFGFNYGAGIKGRINDKFAIRLDVRQYQNGKPFDLQNSSGLLKMNEVSVGFSLVL